MQSGDYYSMEGGGSSSTATAIRTRKRTSYPLRALFGKTKALQKRQKKTNCCQICFPATMVLLIGLLQFAIDQTTNDLGKKKEVNPDVVDRFAEGWYVGRSITYSGTSLGSYDIETKTGTGVLGNLGSVYENKTLPSFDLGGTSGQVDDYLKAKQSAAMEQQDIFGQVDRKTGLLKAVPYESFNFISLNGYVVTYDVQVNNNSNARYCGPKDVGIPHADTLDGFGVPELMDPCAVTDGAISMQMIDSALYRYFKPSGSFSMKVQAMPFKYKVRSVAVAEILGLFFFPIIAMFLLPVFLYSIVMEKQTRLREFMKMHGMRMRHYWFTTFVFDWIIYLLATIVFFAFCAMFQFKFILQTNPLIYSGLYLAWGLSMIAWAIFISAFVRKGNAATISGYAIVLLSSFIGVILELIIWRDQNGRPFIYMMIPPFAFIHGMVYILGRCIDYKCLKLDDIGSDDPWTISMIYLLAMTPVYIAMGLYFDLIVPSDFGIPKHPLFFLKRFSEKKKAKSQAREEENALLATKISSPDEELSVVDPLSLSGAVEEEDDDVLEERRKVERGHVTKEEVAVMIKNLRKIFKGKTGEKVAVNDLCLTMARNECFGLLGPNGAGKTTTISMLCGMYPPSSGTAFIDGKDIRYERGQIHLSMGVCPQHDIIWEDLTCIEHLLFYARLKGIDRDKEMKHAEDIVEKVGLSGDAANRLAKNLSGGMLRRLSIAISLVGDPSIIFLDEPTTGLDPATRRHIWNVISSAKENRCVVLTTHAMDEAETLCDRIGIMSLGRLKCLGNQLHLKNKFGEGYRLDIAFDEEHRADLSRFIHATIPSVREVTSFGGHAEYQVPAGSVKISSLFERFDEKKKELGITDWGISNTSLEDVFLEIIRTEEITPADMK
eukprot:TRINITY_DN1960_c0_g1_i1.p1 TRINITY_DN1960_c0_g1~~TRINITY_DN1960_c0_g1_i1.p1  ORF type:complete len:888 (+),score=242.32 TRINITY_DN1960_c0_g1_i1:206-2869(+)